MGDRKRTGREAEPYERVGADRHLAWECWQREETREWNIGT